MKDEMKHRKRRIVLSTLAMRRFLAVLLCVAMVVSLFVDIAADAKSDRSNQSTLSVTEQTASVSVATESSLVSVPVAVEQSVASEQPADLLLESGMLQEGLLQGTPVKISNALAANTDPYILYGVHTECGTVDNNYNPATRVATLTAQPYSGCKFLCWAEKYVDDEGKDRIRLIQDKNPTNLVYQWTVTTTGRELYAYFIKEGLYYTWDNNDCSEKGTVYYNDDPAPKTGFAPGTKLTITAEAKTGYKVVGIEYAYISRLANEKEEDVEWHKFTGESITLTMPASDVWVRGIFYSTTKRKVTLKTNGHGTVTFKGTDSTEKYFSEGDIVEVTVTPEFHYRLSEIKGLYSPFDVATNSFEMQDIDTELTFNFTYNTNEYAVVLKPSSYHNYLDENLTLLDKSNQLVQFSCSIKEEYKKLLVFEGWYEVVGDNQVFVSSDPVYTFRATRDITLMARVNPGYRIFTAPSQADKITVVPNKDCYLPGEKVTLIATPNDGLYLDKFLMGEYDAEGNLGETYDIEGDTITIGNHHIAVIAQFLQYNIAEIEANDSKAGTVSGSGYYKPNETVKISAIPNEGYEFVEWQNKSNGNTASYEPTLEQNFGDRNGAAIRLVAIFRALPKYTITAKSDSEYGTVTGGGEYYKGSTATLIATPKDNCYFEGWTENGNVVSTNAKYEFPVDKNRTLIAVFKQETVTVLASPNNTAYGSVTGASTYTKGSQVNLIATANTGYRFINWTEENTIVCSEANYSFTAKRDVNLIANFVVDEDTIAVSANNDKYGSVSGGGTYQKGKPVTLTATANNGYIFVNWTENGNVVSTDATYSFPMENARTLVANFKPKTFNVTVSASPSEGGTVEKSGSCEYDTPVTVKATPAEGYRFLNWSEGGNPVSTNAEFSFTVSKDRALTAIFEKIVYYNIGLSPAPLNYGTVTGGGRYEAKTTVDVEAIPKAGFIFTNWTENGTVVSEKAKYTFTASANRTLVAHFDVDYREIKVSTSDATLGSVSGGGNIQVGQKAKVIATANQNCRFVNWTENGVPVSTDAIFEFTVEKERNLVAVFEEIGKVTINAVPSDDTLGSVSGGGTHYIDSTVKLVATAFDNCRFVSWTENGEVVSSSAEYSFTASKTRTLVANFEKIMYTISAEPNNSAYGTVEGAGSYQQGSTVVLTAKATDGYRFVKWTEDGKLVYSKASYSFECASKRNLVAVFEAIPTFTVTVSSNDSTLGSVSGGGSVYEGEPVTVTARANKYCLFVEWQMNGERVSTDSNYRFVPEDNCALVAVFAEDMAKVNVTSNDTTFGSVSGGGEFQKGSDVTVKATAADDDHRFVNWTENGEQVSTSPEYKFTLEKDIALVANFKKIERCTVEAVSSNDAAGSVTGGGVFEVGGTATLIAQPGEEGIFVNWTENGIVVCTTPTYPFTVENDRNLVANFKVKTYTIQVQANDSSYGSVSGGGDFTKGQTATVTATAENGYLFDHWESNGTNVSNQSSYSFNVTGSVVLVAVFKEDPNGIKYPLEVCGVWVTSKNKDSIKGNNITGTVTYEGDAKKGTLTLNNAKLECSGSCIECGAGLELTIRLVGDNSIRTYSSYENANIVGIRKVSGVESITISGTGKLTISNATNGVFSNGALAIKGSTIEISSDRLNSVGFRIGGNINISEKSNITVTVDNETIYCGTGTVTVSDGSELNLTTKAQKATSTECLDIRRDFVVNDGCKLTIKGNSEKGIYVRSGKVNLVSSEVSISALNSAIEAYSGITLGDGIAIATPAGGRISNDGERIVDADGNVAKDVTLTKGITINATASSKEAGTVEGAGCYAQGAGTTVKLKAIPNEGYEFVSWTENGQIVSDKAAYEFSLQDERTLVANFRKKKFTITFMNDDGTKLQSEMVEYGVKPVYNGLTPTKEATKQYTYTFAGWDSEIIEVAGDATYTATYDYKVNSYRIRFVNDDGTELQSEMVEYGVKPVYNGLTPTKEATKQYTYTFAGWDSEMLEVAGDATYTATYDYKVNSYRIRFVDGDGKELQSSMVEYGVVPQYTGEEPARPKTAQYTWIFAGWDKSVVAVTDEETYKAVFSDKLNTYKIRFVDEDGTELQSEVLDFGTKPVYNGKTPAKAATKQYTYTFAGWDNEVIAVAGDATYTAKYDSKINSYQAVFDSNGGSEVSAKTVEYGSKLENVAEPVRKGFDFVGWFTDAACTKKADLTAPIMDDCKFYAGWEEVFFTVTGDTSWDVKSGKDFHIHVTRSRNDDILFGMFGGILLDGKPVDGKYFKAVKGSIDLTVSSELFKTIEDGNHEITVLIGDTSVTTKVAVSNDTGASAEVQAPKTGDTLPMVILLSLVLAALLMSGVVLYRRKNARA